RRTACLRFSRLETFGGLAVPAEEACAILGRLGFETVSRAADRITVRIPTWRNDCAGDPDPQAEYDLIEEVLRIVGLDSVPAAPMPPLKDDSGRARVVPPPSLTSGMARAATARRVLAGRGLAECVTFSFMDGRLAALFGGGDDARRLLNPIASDLDSLRPSVLATLAAAAARNAARGFADLALFEIGPAFQGGEPGEQSLVAAGLRAGSTPRHWAQPSRPVDAIDAKRDAFAVLAALGVNLDGVQAVPEPPSWLHPGRSALLRAGAKVTLGLFGELHPRVLAALDLPGPVAVFELDLGAIASPRRKRRGNPELPAFQPVLRDFAFVVDEAVAAEAVLRAARAADRTLIERVELFDVYRGRGIGPGKKSLAVAVTIQPRERTLTDAELEALADRVVGAVAKATGAVLRSVT
ncbi:MAG: phenylalanine--tRNA ligase subunit beta, partial [Elioraea sp.]|nr:phenylalanine--tRNA ligase subunit beta [Elioraea sp.]